MMNRQLRKRLTLLLTKVDSNDTHTASLVCLFLGIVLACLSPLALLGQAASASPSVKTSCKVSGAVVEREDGKPLKNVRVILQPEEFSSRDSSIQARTGADGRFCFTQAAPGRYRLIAQKGGHIEQTYGVDEEWDRGTILSIDEQHNLDKLFIRMSVAGLISGKIVDKEGDPMFGILVQALVPGPEEEIETLLSENVAKELRSPVSSLVAAAVTVTNDLGEYRLPGLRPYRYLISAVDTGKQLNPLSSPFSSSSLEHPNSAEYAPTFYPGTTSVRQATPIDLRAGENQNADFQLRDEQMINVNGTVFHEDGTPAVGAHVHLSPDGIQIASLFLALRAETDQNGRFTVKNVLSGSFTIEATLYGREEDFQRLFAQRKIEVSDSDVNNVALVLKKGVSLTGKIASEDDPAMGFGRTSLLLLPEDRNRRASPSGFSMIHADGSFELSGTDSGSFRVKVSGIPEQYYLKKVSYGNQTSIDRRVTISPGAHQPSLNLLVSARGARISGVIQNKDGKPVGGALVVLGMVANDDKPVLDNATVSDQKGEFRFQGLAPGKYQISTRLRSKMAANSSVTRTRVALSEGEQKDVTLKLE